VSEGQKLFEGLEPNAETHFRLYFYAAVLRIIRSLRALSKFSNQNFKLAPESFSFLEGYRRELGSFLPTKIEAVDAPGWWKRGLQAWEERTLRRLPLRELKRRLGLTHEEQLALMLAGLVEEDIRFGSLFAALQEPLPARRPSLGLLGALVVEAGASGQASFDWWRNAHRLIDAGLLIAENQSAPRAEWLVRVPPIVWDAMRGRSLPQLNAECSFYSKREFPALKNLALARAFRERLCGLPAILAQGRLGAVILRGMANSGRRTIMGALARTLRRDLLLYECRAQSAAQSEIWSQMGALATLTGALPVVVLDPAPGETVELPPLKGYVGPIGIMMRREGGVSGKSVERAVMLNLPAPAFEHRKIIWRNNLSQHSSQDLETVVERFLLPLGNIARAARIASTYAQLERREAVTVADVRLACRSLNRQKLDTLAQCLEVQGGSWSDLFVNEATASELQELERRCRHRERLLAHLGAGFRNSINCGVRALFNGPSGTGKTLAAKILAAVLQTDIYRVDLASIINKYIGETEKNLSQLLARAEELDVILLIDEGDALMTNRTDVKSANDRYANLETNYLLQRFESYQGIILVTTNAGSRIDTAFHRRFDMLVNFQSPDPSERLLIWQHHLPHTHCVSAAYLHQVAHNCIMTGGQIRNAVLHAALLAVEAERDGEINDFDLESSVQREYRKAGASYPLQPRTEQFKRNGHQAALTQFLAEIN
jgi:histone H3/H4